MCRERGRIRAKDQVYKCVCMPYIHMYIHTYEIKKECWHLFCIEDYLITISTLTCIESTDQIFMIIWKKNM